jgi:hypothetical protein
MLAAIGQLAAVFIGIPSLIYLAIQIRAQTRERRQSAVNALTVQWGDLTRSLHDSADFSAIYLRGLQSFFFKNFEGIYFSHCDGLLTPSLWGEIERSMSDLIAYPERASGGKRGNIGTRTSLPASWMRLSQRAMSPRRTQPTILSAMIGPD